MAERGPGDPEGRRLAKTRAIELAQAGRVAHLLHRLLDRAGHGGLPENLVHRITELEQQALLQAHGRIESRKRFKFKASHPLHDARSPNLLFVDESGRADPSFPEPTFALGAVALDPRAAARYGEAADELKRRFFGRTDFTFHEPQMRRHEEIYSFGGDQAKQRAFCEAVDRLLEDTPFVALGAAIRRDALHSGAATEDAYLPPNMYSIAIHLLMERYVDYLAMVNEQSLGRVTFESQGPRADAEHQREYVELLLHGTQWVPDGAFRNWLETGVQFTTKVGTQPMEIADMFARDLFEWVRGGCKGGPRRWELYRAKIYLRGDMQMGKFGIKVFPDSDIRPAIEAHRLWCRNAN